MKSQQAQVAALCRQYLKAHGIACRVRSDSFSMGDSVDVTVFDQPPEIVKQIDAELSKYQYGRFDGMADCYDVTNRRRDIPQTKYLNVSNDISDGLKQAAYDWLRANWQGGDKLPERYDDAGACYLSDERAQTMVYRLLSGALNGSSVSFWETRKPKQPEPVAVPTGARIEEHTHTKKSFQMFICVFPRVDRVEFDRLLSKARDAGGWYSRQWGTTPGGFAFKTREAAEAFTRGEDVPTPTTDNAPAGTVATGNPTTAARLRTIADGMRPAIDDKFRDRMTNTPKRLAQAEHARLEGHQLERAQKMLLALADMHEAGTVPAVLQNVKTKAEAYRLASAKKDTVANGFHTYHVETRRPYYETPDALAAWALLEDRTPEQEKAEKLRRLVQGLQFSNIPGYFPTPAELVARMMNRANVEPGQKALEPSAGHGAIADALREAGADVTAVEASHTLAEILTAKGYADPWGDFMEKPAAPVFDRVVMNPPFEKMQDVDHVRHAFDCLKPGGRLVAIMSAGTFFNQTRKAAEFREWLGSLGGESEEIPAGAFKEAGTGVASRLVVVDKGGAL